MPAIQNFKEIITPAYKSYKNYLTALLTGLMK